MGSEEFDRIGNNGQTKRRVEFKLNSPVKKLKIRFKLRNVNKDICPQLAFVNGSLNVCYVQ